MRVSTVVMIAFAVLFGLLAVFIAQSWLNSQAEMRMRSLEANRQPVATQTIVVASKSLRFRKPDANKPNDTNRPDNKVRGMC